MVKIKYFGILKPCMPQTEEDGYWHADKAGTAIGQILEETEVIGKAENNGLTFNQQAVLEALWVMYKDQDAEGNPKISWSVMDRLAEKVRNL